MTHYSRYCLHLGCGEPLDNPSARLFRSKKRAGKKTLVKKGKPGKDTRVMKKDR